MYMSIAFFLWHAKKLSAVIENSGFHSLTARFFNHGLFVYDYVYLQHLKQHGLNSFSQCNYAFQITTAGSLVKSLEGAGIEPRTSRSQTNHVNHRPTLWPRSLLFGCFKGGTR